MKQVRSDTCQTHVRHMSVSQRRNVDLLVTPDGKLQSQNTMGLKAVSEHDSEQ